MSEPLNEYPRIQLQFIIAKFGSAICDDPPLCEAMLWDLCPEYKREVRVLVAVLQENIIHDLLQQSIEMPLEQRLKALSQRLYDNWGIAEDFAVWAVESWALALNLMPPVADISASLAFALQQQIGKFLVQEGIATDTETELTWLRFSYGQTWHNGAIIGNIKVVNWKTVSYIIKKFNQQGGYAGFTDWRLPTVDELKTLLDKVKGKQGHCIDQEVFPGDFFSFWAFFPGYQGNKNPWVVNFVDGKDSYTGEYNGYGVRLVRGGGQTRIV